MLFSELYSAYYNTVAKIVKSIIVGDVDKESIYKIIEENAFEESAWNIVSAIKEERWQFITHNYKTPIKHNPTMPLTTLQKMWLKAILMDARVKLFDISVEGLDDVEPLFTKVDYCIYDRYTDGDNFEDEKYIERFKTILYALRNKKAVKVEMISRAGDSIYLKFVPERIEYSEKDDKFRVRTGDSKYISAINIARITKCKLVDGIFDGSKKKRKAEQTSVTLVINDERNALERTMHHFAHFEKQVEKIGGKKYKATIKYDRDDEPEMVIRILSFGPLVEVVEPIEFRELIKNKLKKQQSCGLK